MHIDDRQVSRPLREVSSSGKQGEHHRPAYLDAVMTVNCHHRCERPWREVPGTTQTQSIVLRLL